jgi:hypothetical protein
MSAVRQLTIRRLLIPYPRRCHREEKILISITFEAPLPPVIAVHLKRYAYNQAKNKHVKLRHEVELHSEVTFGPSSNGLVSPVNGGII